MPRVSSNFVSFARQASILPLHSSYSDSYSSFEAREGGCSYDDREQFSIRTISKSNNRKGAGCLTIQSPSFVPCETGEEVATIAEVVDEAPQHKVLEVDFSTRANRSREGARGDPVVDRKD